MATIYSSSSSSSRGCVDGVDMGVYNVVHCQHMHALYLLPHINTIMAIMDIIIVWIVVCIVSR